MTLVSSAIRNDCMCGLTSNGCLTCYWLATPITTVCVPMSGRQLTPNTSEPTARMNAAIVPTANNSPAKKEETPRIRHAECQMVPVYAHDRLAIKQNFHDVKEVHGAGEQKVRHVWCNVACWNLCLWLHTMVELWSWRRSGTTLKQRDDRPWDAPNRCPSQADRLKTLKNDSRDIFCTTSPPTCCSKNPAPVSGVGQTGQLN